MKHILAISVKNKPGVMSHVSGLFTRRGFNIDSIAVGVTDKADVSSMTIVLRGEHETALQFQGQLEKLPDVVEVRVLPYHDSHVRELILVRVKAPDAAAREDVFGIAEVFGGKIAEITADSMMIEVSGTSRQVNGFLKLLARHGIVNMARTGQIALQYSADEG